MSETVMSETDPPNSDQRNVQKLPKPVVEHVLLFGREETSGYLIEHGIEHGSSDAVSSIAERVEESTEPAEHEERRSSATTVVDSVQEPFRW